MTGADLPGGLEATAAEYALGLLTDEERHAFEAEMARDPALRQDVAAWTEYFTTLTETLPDITPPQQVFRRVESVLFATAKVPLWRQLVPYVVGAVIGALLTWAVFMAGGLSQGGTGLRADLLPVEDGPTLLARFDAEAVVLAVELTRGTVTEEAAIEVWLIAEEGARPLSLGVLGPDGVLLRRLSPSIAETLPGARLAVTSERAGGSLTGAPSGLFLAAGVMGPP